jgi:hypothetical protein
MTKFTISATRVTALIFGIASGLLGLEHGYYETLQGNVKPDGLLIRAMGAPCQVVTSPVGCEPAMIILPSFLVTGMLAILVSLLIITWASTLVQRKNGGTVLILLSLVLLLVGGGFTSLPFGILAGLAGMGINPSPTGWHAYLSAGLRHTLGKFWPWSLIACNEFDHGSFLHP